MIRRIFCNVRGLATRASGITARPRNVQDGPGLADFLVVGKNLPKPQPQPDIPYLQDSRSFGGNRKVFFEVYGCQMNTSDTEIVWAILQSSNYVKVDTVAEAEVILLVTCAIRDLAEQRIWARLKQLAALKRDQGRHSLQVGVLGCMAERLKTQLLEKEKLVDVVAGPDSYRDLPRLLHLTERNDQRAVNVLLSLDETYADVAPVKLNKDAVTAFVSVMRGCDNLCSYCIVPFTRGRERSRAIDSVRREVASLWEQGVKEVTLLGQNVNSYNDRSADMSAGSSEYVLRAGFKTVYKAKASGLRFADLLDQVAADNPEMRFRFTSPHPKDFPTPVLEVIASHNNICKALHIPIQAGCDAVLERMRRGYTRAAYMDLVAECRRLIPGIALSSDFICGFCGETEAQFAETLAVMRDVGYHMAYMFAYSMREKTTAHRRYTDDVPASVKQDRLQRLIRLYRENVERIYGAYVGQVELVLVEGTSKRRLEDVYGRNDGNVKVIMPQVTAVANGATTIELRPGDFVAVRITAANSQVLKGTPLYKTSLTRFYEPGTKERVEGESAAIA